MPIAVDIPLRTEALRIAGLRDSSTWEADELRLAPPAMISLWVAGLPENADRNNVGVWIGGMRLAIDHITPPPGDNPRQMNVRAPLGAKPGDYFIKVSIGDISSAPGPVKFLPGKDRRP